MASFLTALTFVFSLKLLPFDLRAQSERELCGVNKEFSFFFFF